MEKGSSNSNFIFSKEMDFDKSFTDFTEIQSSGFNRIVKAKRYGKWYILKGLKDEYISQTIYLQLLRKEFDVSVNLSHPNIVQTVSWENVEGIGSCIVFEYVDGITLKEFLKTHNNIRLKRKLVDELLSAVEYIASMQVVHRDLKPSNIMVTKNGSNLKIIDFGLSDTDSYNILKQPAGTEKYISPEQRNTSVPDCRNDIFSVGKILLEMNAGWAYNSVAHKCCLKIDKRYKTVLEIRNGINSRIKILRFLSVGIAVACFIFALLYSFGNFQEKTVVDMPVFKDTVYVSRTDTVFIEKYDTLTKYKIDTLTNVKIDTLVSFTISDNNYVDSIIDMGKHKVDERFAPVIELVNNTEVYTDDFEKEYSDMTKDLVPWLLSTMDSLTVGMDNICETTVKNAIERYYTIVLNKILPRYLKLKQSSYK